MGRSLRLDETGFADRRTADFIPTPPRTVLDMSRIVASDGTGSPCGWDFAAYSAIPFVPPK